MPTVRRPSRRSLTCKQLPVDRDHLDGTSPTTGEEGGRVDYPHEAPRVRLIGTRLAPPIELMKWLHEQRQRPYEEVVNAPGFHAFWSWRYRVAIEPPLVVTPQGPTGGLRD